MVYAGFRDARRDIRDPPVAKSAQASPDPHDEELMDARPDQEEMEEAINRFLLQMDMFLLQMEKQEKKGLKDLASVFSLLPKPAQGSVCPISVADAIEAGFLPAVDEDQANMFTPSELRLYRHAQDHSFTRDIPGYPKLFCEIPGYTGMEGCPDAPGDKYAADSHVLCDRNFNVACETGIRYPTLPAMLNRDAMLIRIR